MKRAAYLTALPLLALALAAQAPPTPPVLDHTGLTPVRVTDCLDGGRLVVDVNGQSLTVHLLGVRATDPHDRAPSLSQNGDAAKTMLTSLAVGEQVFLEPDQARTRGNVGPRWPRADAQGVLQAHVWRMRDTLLLNAELVKQGLVFYNSADQPRSEYLSFYSWCQRQANDAHLGLWSSEQLVAAGLPTTATPPPPGGTLGNMPPIALPGELETSPPLDTLPAEIGGAVSASANLPTGLSIGAVSGRMVHQGRASRDFSWSVALHNDNARRLRVNVTVRFLDQDGYVLGEATRRGVTLAAHGDSEAKGTRRLNLDKASKVASLDVLAVRAR